MSDATSAVPEPTLPEGRAVELHRFEERSGYRFRDQRLLDRALTHSSFANESLGNAHKDNEPLEFLGDAVLGLIIAEHLHRIDPDGEEGEKTQMMAQLVSTAILSRKAQELAVPAVIRFSRGEERSGGRSKPALWADAMEAVIAAVYLDSGLEAARALVLDKWRDDIELCRRSPAIDHKTRLQEWMQARRRALPEYVVVAEEGPGHAKYFRVECRLDDGLAAEGEGRTKKGAQQEAAQRVLSLLGQDAPDVKAP